MSIFDKFNQSVDLKGLKEDVENASENTGGNYVEVPNGIYEVKIVKGEVRASKKGDPMVSIWFRILNGDYARQYIFLNQIITQGFQIHIVNEFLKSLDTGLDIVFNDYGQYNQLLMDVVEVCDKGVEFALDYNVNKKGFHTYKIVEIFEPLF